MHYNIFSAD